MRRVFAPLLRGRSLVKNAETRLGLTVDGLDIAGMKRDHLDEVLRIEKEAFTNPWSRWEFGLGKNDGLSVVAMLNGSVIGYAVGFSVGEEFHLANFAIRRESRRKGFGTSLLTWILEEVRAKGAKLVTLEVRMSNRAAIGLYKKHGFWGVAIRRDYYSFPREDALVMMKTLEGDS